MIFVEQGQHPDRQFARRIVTEGLSNRNDANLVTLKLRLVLHEMQGIAKQAR
nr:hypothetical protein [Sphingobium agri]